MMVSQDLLDAQMVLPVGRLACDTCGEPVVTVGRALVVARKNYGSGALDRFQVVHKGACDTDQDDASWELYRWVGTENDVPTAKATYGQVEDPAAWDEFIGFVLRVRPSWFEEVPGWRTLRADYLAEYDWPEAAAA